jgi:hypothetical protein
MPVTGAERVVGYPRDDYCLSQLVPIRRCRKSRIGRARVVTTLQKLVPPDAEEKKRCRRADLRNCPAADDEIVPGRTRRDGRQAGTTVTLRSRVARASIQH